MKRKPEFDEVMIVNPSEQGSNTPERVRLMRFHNIYPPELGDFADPGYGYYGEPVEDYGYFAEDPYLSQYGYYGETDPTVGYYGETEPGYGYYGQIEPGYGYYGELDPTMGYYGEPPYYGPAGGYGQAEPVGYFAEEFPVGYYGEEFPVAGYGEEFPVGYYGEEPYQPMGYYGQVPEMVGYGQPEMQFSEEYPGMAYYGEPDYTGYSGYVRETAPTYNPGCPLPTNLSGYDGFEGYARPTTVNPSCDQITPQPGSAPSPPDTFKPLW